MFAWGGSTVVQRGDLACCVRCAGPASAERLAQPPLIAGILIGACLAKLGRVLRSGSVDAGLGPTQLFPLRLRRPLAMLMCAFEMALGPALLVTVFPVGTRSAAALFAPRAATGAPGRGRRVLPGVRGRPG
jgi:hypothetical protein